MIGNFSILDSISSASLWVDPNLLVKVSQMRRKVVSGAALVAIRLSTMVLGLLAVFL